MTTFSDDQIEAIIIAAAITFGLVVPCVTVVLEELIEAWRQRRERLQEQREEQAAQAARNVKPRPRSFGQALDDYFDRNP